MNISINQFDFEMIKYPVSLISYARYADDFMGAIKRPQRQGKTTDDTGNDVLDRSLGRQSIVLPLSLGNSINMHS